MSTVTLVLDYFSPFGAMEKVLLQGYYIHNYILFCSSEC